MQWLPLMLIAVLAAVLVLAWSGGGQVWVPPPPQPPNPDSLLPVSVERKTLDFSLYTEQVERPLFVPGRRPRPEAAEVEVAAPSRPITEITLIGLFASGAEQGAMIRTRDGTVRRVAIGEASSGFVLQGIGIDGDRAVFSDGSREHVLTLRPTP